MTNEKKILKAFANHRAMELAGIEQITGLNKIAILRILSRLIRAGTVQRIKHIMQPGKRPGISQKTIFRLRKETTYIQTNLFDYDR